MSIKVLVADDSITIQKVIGIIFGGDEYSLTVVDNGKAAVEKAREINPDVLLIDALMPGMTGYEVAEMVRATPALATKPILLLTGSFEPFDEDKAKKCGADDFIAKPFESQQIIAKVKELLELGNSRAQSPASPAAEQPAPTAPPLVATAEVPVIPEVPVQEAPPADIWGAFTPDVQEPAFATEPAVVPAFQEVQAVEPAEPDVFAIVSEEDNVQLVQESAVTPASPQHTGSQWIPVDENTFEFEEAAEPPAAVQPEVFAAPETPVVQEPSFGDISFEDTVEPPAIASVPEDAFAAPDPGFAEPSSAALADFATAPPLFESPVAVPEPFAPLADPVAVPVFSVPTEPEPVVVTSSPSAAPTTVGAVELTEEQLKVALSSVSKDVIERIVWEVVPDLAEAMIREAIRRIKEGV